MQGALEFVIDAVCEKSGIFCVDVGRVCVFREGAVFFVPWLWSCRYRELNALE